MNFGLDPPKSVVKTQTVQRPTVAIVLVVQALLTACSTAPSQNLGSPPPLPVTAEITSPEQVHAPPPDKPQSHKDWHTYTNDGLGITFQYWCWVKEEDGLVTFSGWNWLATHPANGLRLDEYVDQFVQQLGAYQFPVKDEVTLNRDPRGIIVRAVIAHHDNRFAFFQRGDVIYQFSTRLNILTECSAQEIGLLNPAPFYRAIETFRFTR